MRENSDTVQGASGILNASLLELGQGIKLIQYTVELRQPPGEASVNAIEDLVFFFIDPGVTPRNILLEIERRAALNAKALSEPVVISRTEWGCPDGQFSPRLPPKYTTVTHLIVHHTDGSNTSSDWPGVVRGIWNQHTNINDGTGWGDIGYNYLIDPNGVIYEGRAGGNNVEGVHFTCRSGNTMGVAMLGNYESVVPTDKALDSLRGLLAWKAREDSIDPLATVYHPPMDLYLKTISGHRDGNVSPSPLACIKHTVCPGDSLYALLPTLRSDVSSILASSAPSPPANLRQLAYDGSEVSQGEVIDPGSVTITGNVNSLTGEQVLLEVELSGPSYGTERRSSGYVNSGSVARVCFAGLPNGSYSWRARTVERSGGVSPWVSYNGTPQTSINFIVEALSCAPCSASGSIAKAVPLAAGAKCGSGASLSATLSATPSSGTAPLNDVDLMASVSGSATGTINYTFYCNRDDAGTDIRPGYAAKYDGISTNPKTAANICDYSTPGTYTAKVIVERGSTAAEARRTITVGASSSSAPVATTLAATSVTQASATFNATVHPQGSVTTFWFDYGTDSSVSQATSPQTLAAATSQSAVSISQGGLACGRQYFYRARASNAAGAATPGTILSFNTDSCDGGGSQTVQLVVDSGFEAGNNAWWVANPDFYIDGKPEFPNPRNGNNYAFLSLSNGTKGNNLSGGFISPILTIPANASDADLRFYYRITSDETTTTQKFDKLDVYLVLPGNQLNLLGGLSNLDENGTSYSSKSFDLSSSFYGEAVQIFFAGSTDSSLPTVFRIDDVTLEVDVEASADPPSVSTGSADQITASSARVSMTVNPNGSPTEAWFDLEAGDSTPSVDTEHLIIGSGSQSESVSISVFNLQCGTLYYFKANARNDHGSDSGSVRSFSTNACNSSPPEADTDPAASIGQTSATLTADVTANGLPTQAWFAWGTSASLDQETQRINVGSAAGSVDFSQTLSGLNCGTTYYFQNRVSSTAGEDSGSILSFDTLPCDGGGGPSAQGFFLDNRRLGCRGGGPAVLLWWTAPAGMDNIFTIRRTDGAYTATVDASQEGMAHLVSSLLVPGETYSFHVEGVLNGSTVQTNAVTVAVVSDECRLPVGQGELPHLPLAWTGIPFCSGGTASVPVYWTAVEGAASYTLTRIDNDAGQLIPYPGLAGTSMTDTGLVPGTVYEYLLEAVGDGGRRQANRISVFLPSGLCGEPASPGAFSAQVSAPVCVAGKGAVTLSWTASSGAASGMRTHWADDGFASGSGRTFSGSSKVIDGLRPGALVKLMVQAESAATPGKYRSVILSQRVPLDICGGAASLPAATTVAATYIQEQQALLRASIVPNAGSSSASFEWGTSPSFGSATPQRNAGDGYRSVSLGETLTGLACNTTYYFRVRAANAAGQATGATLEFTTKPCGPVAPAGGGCGRVLVQQPRDQFGGCDASDTGTTQWVAENFRLSDTRKVSCLEVLGYHWPGNNPPPASVFDVVIYGMASGGTPGAALHQGRGIQARREKTGVVSVSGLEEWRFTIELPSPVELTAGDFFAEISGTAVTGGGFCWIGGEKDPVAGLNGMAFRHTGAWSLGNWDLAFKIFEAGIFVDGFESGTLEEWSGHSP